MLTLRRRAGRWGLSATLLLIFASVFSTPAFGAASAGQAARSSAVVAADPVLEGIPRFEPAKCGFTLEKDQKEGTGVNCGYVVVPEHHGNPTGPTIRLAVARFRSTSQAAVEPIVYLEGGPGAGSLDSSAGTFAARFTAGNDFILFDQRGIGQSQPALTCPEVTKETEHSAITRESAAEDQGHFAAALIRCHDRLAGKYDLTAYTTAESAADVSDIRLALGYAKVKLLGGSYGSRLALTVMRDYPQIVVSSVIDAVAPPQRDIYGESAVNFDRALDLFFASCVADSACNAAFPTLRADFSSTVAKLNAEPLNVSTSSSVREGRGSPPIVLTGDRLVQLTLRYLYSAERIRYLPMVIEQLKDGNTALLRALFRSASDDSSSFSEGMAWSVWCGDYLPFSNQDKILAATRNVLPEIQSVYLTSEQSAYAICAQWGSAPPNPIENQAVTSDVPTLVLASANDPVTPPAYARAAVQTLSHGIYVEGPGIGHSLLGNGGACASKIVRDFFADPGGKPDTACIDAQRVRFLTNTKRYLKPPPLAIDLTKKYTATIVTTKGTITFDLLANVAPRAVNSFVSLADDHFFDGMDFYSITPGIGIATGDPTALGSGGPGYTFPDEPIPADLDYERGVVVMSNDGKDTNGSRFVVIAGDQRSNLAKKYTIFAKVTGGMEVVDQILTWQEGNAIDPEPTVVSVTIQVSLPDDHQLKTL